MAAIDIRYPHNTTQADARDRAKRIIDRFIERRREHIKTVDWSADGNRVEADGRGFNGVFLVTDAKVVITMKLSFLLKPMKNRIETGLLKKLQEEFGPRAA